MYLEGVGAQGERGTEEWQPVQHLVMVLSVEGLWAKDRLRAEGTWPSLAVSQNRGGPSRGVRRGGQA